MKHRGFTRSGLTLTGLTLVLPFIVVGFLYPGWKWRIFDFVQIPYKVKSSSREWEHYHTYIEPEGHLMIAPQSINLDPETGEIREFIVANDGTRGKSTQFGIELRSIGFLPKGSTDNSHLRVPPVPNPADDRFVGAKIVAWGAIKDTATRGLTASCFTFQLKPGEIAEVPFVAVTRGIKGAWGITYAVMVKQGDDVRCQMVKTEDSDVYTGLLEPETGREYHIDALPIIVGRL